MIEMKLSAAEISDPTFELLDWPLNKVQFLQLATASVFSY